MSGTEIYLKTMEGCQCFPADCPRIEPFEDRALVHAKALHRDHRARRNARRDVHVQQRPLRQPPGEDDRSQPVVSAHGHFLIKRDEP